MKNFAYAWAVTGIVFMFAMTIVFTIMAFKFMAFNGWEWIYIIPYLFVQSLAFFAYYEKVRNRNR